MCYLQPPSSVCATTFKGQGRLSVERKPEMDIQAPTDCSQPEIASKGLKLLQIDEIF